MKKSSIAIFASFFLLPACGESVEATVTASGNASVAMNGETWNMEGSCEKSGDGLLFVRPGDPMLTIGINTASGSAAIGNFSSVSQGFGVLIGRSEAPIPEVEFNGSSFVVNGVFTVIDGTLIDGTISVDCKF